MQTKLVKQHKCDFCGKKGLSSYHMKRHEIGCTANPARECRFHHNVSEEPAPSVQEMAALLSTRKPDHGMTELRAKSSGCPMCILAAIRLYGIAKWDGDIENPTPDLKFDFKKELADIWAGINADNFNEEQEKYAAHYY